MIYVALLRGINVGGNNLISMKILKECFESLGFTEVKTYINSGNVIFKADNHADQVREKIEKSIEKTFGFYVKVLIRDIDEIEKVIKQIPKKWTKPEDFRYNVIFLDKDIDTSEIVGQIKLREGVDELSYSQGVLFGSVKISEATKSLFAKIVGTSIYKSMTIRNLNTTQKIYKIMQELY